MRKVLTAAALVAAASLMVPQAASARTHHRHRMMAGRTRAPKLIPAVAKPGFHASRTPTLIDPVPVAPGGGVLGLGVVPSSGIFKGVPIVGDFGL